MKFESFSSEPVFVPGQKELLISSDTAELSDAVFQVVSETVKDIARNTADDFRFIRDDIEHGTRT